MPQIPDPSSLGGATPKPALDVATPNRLVYRPGGIGEAVEREADEADNLQYATARSTFLQGKVALETQLQQDPNWQAAPQAYADGVKKLQSDAVAMLPNTRLAQRFNAEAGVDIAAGAADMSKFVHGKVTDQARGELDNLLDGNRRAALLDPTTAPALIQQSLAAVDAAHAQGYISDAEAVNTRQKWTEDYGKGYLAMLGPANAYRTLTGHPALGAGGDLVDMIPTLEKTANGVVSKVNGAGRVLLPGEQAGGVYQITRDTAKTFGIDWEKARTNPVYAKQSAQTILTAYSSQLGGDPEATIVAYNGGVGLAKKWLASGKSDAVLPKETRDYLNNYRKGGGATGIGDIGTGDEPIIGKTGTPADFVDPAERAVLAREYFRQAQTDGAVSRQAAAQTVDDQIAYLRSGADPSQVTITPDMAAAMVGGGVNGDKARTLFQQAIDYNHAARELAMAPPETVNKILSDAKPTGTVDFAGKAQNFNDLRTIALTRQNALASDPAAYAVKADPMTGQTYQQANSSPQAFDAYVARLNGAYTQLGQPPDKRNLLPVTDAKRTVAEVLGAKPQDAVARLESLQQTTGRWWPKVYGELVKAGLPSTYQALTVASPHDAAIMAAALQRPTKELEQGIDLGVKTDGKDDLDTAIDADDGLASLKASFNAYGPKGLDLYTGTRAAVRQTALYLMNQGQSAGDAATHAAAMVTSPFDFMPNASGPPARVPHGLGDQAAQLTGATLDRLTDKDVRPYGHLGDQEGNQITASPDDLRQAALHGAKTAWWMTIPGHDGNPVLRAIDPQTNHPVIMANGGFLDVPLSAPVAAPTPPPAGTKPVTQTANPGAIGGLKIPSKAPRVPVGRRVH